MAKIIYHAKRKSVLLSHVETALLLAGEFGAEMLDAFFPKKYPETWLTRRLLGLDTFDRTDFHLTKHRLIRRGLVAKHGASYAITARGQRLLGRLTKLLEDRLPAWDKQWRIIVFDIPEPKKKYREALRRALANADYQRLQDSVWVGKHPLPDDVLTFIEECNLAEYIHLFLSTVVNREEQLTALFSGTKDDVK